MSAAEGGHLALSRILWRPDNLKPFEYRLGRIINGKPVAQRLPCKVPSMGVEPPSARAIPFTLLPREAIIDGCERFHLDFGGAQNALRRTLSIEDHPEIPRTRNGLAGICEVALQRGGSCLFAVDDKGHEL